MLAVIQQAARVGVIGRYRPIHRESERAARSQPRESNIIDGQLDGGIVSRRQPEVPNCNELAGRKQGFGTTVPAPNQVLLLIADLDGMEAKISGSIGYVEAQRPGRSLRAWNPQLDALPLLADETART